MKMKKLLSALLSVVLLFSLSACGGEGTSTSNPSNGSENAKSNSATEKFLKTITAETAEAKGVCGSDLTWYYQDNVLVIKGTGPMTDYYIELKFLSSELTESSIVPPWFEFRNDIGMVLIDEGCTSIGDYAFLACGTLSKIDLPNGVETIGDYAFNNCTNLFDAGLPSGLIKIGNGAFAGCKMEKLVLPDTLEHIGDDALVGCNGLTEITIPASVKTMGDDVFNSCENMTTVTFAGDAPSDLYRSMWGLEDGITVYYSGTGFEESMEYHSDLNWVKQ